jgi:transcriptional regulator with XRE-family HTH domain
MSTTISIVGKTIKGLRSKRGLTLEEVAEKSGCTSGFLSQLERNKVAPSVTTLYSIAEALGAKITDFLPDNISPAKISRHDSREIFNFEGSAICYSLLSTKFPHAALAGFLLTILPSNQALPTDETRAHMSEEFIYVMDGVLRLWIGDGFYDLYPKDSVYFKSTFKHRLENRGNQPVVALSIITPSLF